jgi:phage shock protein PspC (stress-responsive transcriptional regulator)
MQASQPSLIARDHTILGVCEALGEDFGFNPLWLRAAFALPMIWAPLTTVAVYLAAGVIVLLSRLLSPNPRRAAALETWAPAEAQHAPVAAGQEVDQYRLPIAA